MKKLVTFRFTQKMGSFLMIALFVCACASTKDKNIKTATNGDTLSISNDSLNYELIVFETGFDTWLQTQLPIGSYTIEYLESKNQRMISEYNRRARNPVQYGKLYPAPINYDPKAHYGKKVNYKLYNYLEYFQEKYDQRL